MNLLNSLKLESNYLYLNLKLKQNPALEVIKSHSPEGENYGKYIEHL